MAYRNKRVQCFWLTLCVVYAVLMKFCAGSTCYYGTTHKAKAAPLDIMSCTETGQLNATAARNSTSCVIFYDSVHDQATFGCDKSHMCAAGVSYLKNSACYNGVRGSLYCCAYDDCNTAQFLYHMSPPQASLVCYNGTNDGVNPVIREVYCPHGCYRSSVRLSDGQLLNETFSCDTTCTDELPDTVLDRCTETTLHYGMRQRSCTCAKDRCNSKVHHRIPADFISPETASTPAPFRLPDEPCFGHYGHPHFKLVLVGVILVTVLLVALLTVVVVRCHRYRRGNPSIAYVQLSSDSSKVPL